MIIISSLQWKVWDSTGTPIINQFIDIQMCVKFCLNLANNTFTTFRRDKMISIISMGLVVQHLSGLS